MYDYSDYVSNKENFMDMLLSNGIYQIIYQWIVLALLIAILIFVILIFVKTKKNSQGNSYSMSGYAGVSNVGRLVFCKNCGTQCDSNAPVCPKCGARRF